MLFMSDRKNIVKLLAFLLILALSLGACTGIGAAEVEYEEAPVSPAQGDSALDGILMSMEEAHYSVAEGHFRVEPATVRDLSSLHNINVNIQLTNIRRLTFERTNGWVAIQVDQGDYVQEGDVLATLTHDISDELRLSHVRAQNRLNQFDRRYAAEHARLNQNRETARENFYAASDANRDRMALLLTQAELAYRRFLFDTEEDRAPLVEQLEAITEIIEGEQLLSPINGRVTNIAGRHRFFVTEHPQVVTVLSEHDFVLAASIHNAALGAVSPYMPHNALIRFGQEFTVRTERQITDEDGTTRPALEFRAKAASDPWSVEIQPVLWFRLIPFDMQALLDDIAAIDLTIERVMRQERLIIEAPVDMAPGSLTIPTDALREGPAYYFIFLYENGRLIRRNVIPGIRRGDYVQILSGIEEGALVVVFE